MQEPEAPLRQKLAETRRRWRSVRVLSGLAWTFSVLVGLSVICYYVDRVSPLSPTGCVLWRNGIGLATLAVFCIALRSLLRPLPDTALAADVERRYPVLRERLLTTLELAPAFGPTEGAGASGFSRALIGELAQETQREAAHLDFRSAVNLQPLRRAAGFAAGALLLFVSHVALANAPFTVWMERMAHPYADIAPYAATRVWISASREVLPRGEEVGITVVTRGPSADRCVLHFRPDNAQPWQTVEVPTAPSGQAPDSRRYTYRFPSLSQGVTLYATANDGRSNERHIAVEDRPTLLNLQMTLRFPAYMHRNTQIVNESTGNITAPVGTEVEIQATANKPLRSAVMARDGAAPTPWSVHEETTSGHLSLWKNGVYTIQLTDTKGFTTSPPPHYELRAVPDGPPSVEITHPAADIDLVSGGSLPLVAHADDDFGVTRMNLVHTIERDSAIASSDHKAVGAAGRLALPGPTGAPQADIAVRWSIAELRAKAGDYVRYVVEAVDNDTLPGPHTGRSQAYRIHIVDLADMQQRLKDQLDEETRALAQLRQRQQEAQVNRAVNKSALAKAQDTQRALAQETQSLAQRAEQLSAQLENNNLATPSELARRTQATQTLQALADQKMPDAAKQLERAATSPAEHTASLAQANHTQGAIQRDIEHAQDLLARPDSAKKLADLATDLALKQNELAGSARNLAEDLSAARQSGTKGLTKEQRDYLATVRQRQAETNAATKRLQEQLGKAAQAAAEHGQKAEAEALQRAAGQLQQGQVASRQQQAQNSLQQNNPQQAAPNQEKAAASLQKAAEAAREAAASSMPDTPQTAQERLEQSAQRLQDMANRQSQIAQRAAQNPGAAQSRKLAQQERALQKQAQQMQSAMQSAPQAGQSLQNAQESMDQAAKQMGSPSAQSPANKAAQQLQQAAQQASAAAQQLKQQQIAAEMQERVNYLAQIQRGLRDTTRRLHERQQHDGLSDDEKEELNQTAERQKQNQQDTQDLARKMPSASFKDALRMAAGQMQPAVTNLNRAQPNTDSQTQSAQEQASQTLDTIAEALKQQSQSGSQQDSEQNGGQSGSSQQAQKAASLGDLILSRGLQRQVRQNTSALDQARAHNPNQGLTDAQKEEASRLAQGQRTAQSIARRAAKEMPQTVDSAVEQMQQAAEKLGQKETGQPTQSNQDAALRVLEHAIQQAQQEQQQQQQQQSQQGSQSGMPQPSPSQNGMPGKSPLLPLNKRPTGRLSSPDPRTGAILNLSQRSQRTLQQGQQERVPPEFQDWVSRYYRSLSSKKQK